MLTVKKEELLDTNMFQEDEFVAGSLLVSDGLADGDVSQASNDALLFSTLCEIDKNNYLYLFERCKAHNINARQLRFLEKEHIRRIIPLDQVGVMAEFEYYHNKWRSQIHQSNNSVGFNPQPMTLQIQSTSQSSPVLSFPASKPATTKASNIKKTCFEFVAGSETTSDSPPLLPITNEPSEEMVRKDTSNTTKTIGRRKYEYKKRYRSRASVDRVNENEYVLDDIIKHDMRIMREEYKANGILTERDRRRLAAALVEYFQKHDIYMSKDIMESLAVQISNVFPTESKLAWHDDQGRQRRGRLTLKLYNTQRKKLRKYSKTSEPVPSVKTKSIDTDETVQGIESLNEDDREAERLRVWLRNNKYKDNDEIAQIWYETSSYRTKQMKKYSTSNEEHLDEILEKWPAYKLSIGNTLINIDFNFIYPDSEHIFHERWQVFMDKIHKLYKLEVRLELYDRYYKNKESLNEETKESILIQLLHAIVRPTRPISPKQMARRYAIVESQNAFSKVIADESEIEDYSAAQPMIFITGSTFNVEKVFVAFKDMRFELKFKEAFYTCLQIFQLYKIDFPMACLNFWTLIQIYFFNIQPEPDINLSVIDHIIKFLLS